MIFNDAFILYGQADSLVLATKLDNHLKEKGFNIWFDHKEIPRAVYCQEQINDGMAKADNVIFIIAPHSVNYPHCLK